MTGSFLSRPASVLALSVVGVLVLGGCSGVSRVPVSGVVVLGPFCPVEGPGQECPVPPGAFEGASVTVSPGPPSSVFPLAADGSFSFSLPPGRWSLSATAGMGCSAVVVDTTGAAPVSGVRIECDTGIR